MFLEELKNELDGLLELFDDVHIGIILTLSFTTILKNRSFFK